MSSEWEVELSDMGLPGDGVTPGDWGPGVFSGDVRLGGRAGRAPHKRSEQEHWGPGRLESSGTGFEGGP